MPSVAEIIVYIMYKIKIVQFINQCALPGLPEWPFCGQIIVIKWPIEVIGCYTLLWPKAKTFSKTHKGYSWLQTTTVKCGLAATTLIKVTLGLIC